MLDALCEPKVVSSQTAPDNLRDTLDNLLERYLHLVHQYQALQESLAKNFSSGYFLLAQANFTNPNRIRYGQGFYDNRMQASTRCNVSSPPEGLSSHSPTGRYMEDMISVTTLPLTRKTPVAKQADNSEDSAANEKDVESEPRILDPLNWFGILIPPAVRASQSSFKRAVEGTTPSLANVSNEMKALEIEIRRTRKKIRKTG